MKQIKRNYFAASNSAEGFKSYYGNVFDVREFSRIYVIKGGPGTGKSSFMKVIASEAEQRGLSVTRIYCSSDPLSLDGVIIEELGAAVLDGTAPHIFEPSLVGAIESIVDMGAFLNTSLLVGSRKVIEELNKQKSECFERAYGYLAAYKRVSDNMERLIRPCLKREKLQRFAGRFAEGVRGTGKEKYLLVRSVGMNGSVSFDTYRQNADIYYRVEDHFETGHFLMQELYGVLKRADADMYLAPDPIISTRYNAISVNGGSVVFEVADGAEDSGARSINMKRFIDNVELVRVRSDFRIASRIRDNLLELAEGEFDKTKKYHFTLEEIYGAAIDFDAKEQFTKEFCDKIFSK